MPSNAIFRLPREQILLATFCYQADGMIGSGFVYRHHEAGVGNVHFLVTNKHVVERSERATCRLVRPRVMPGQAFMLGDHLDLSITLDGWRCHPTPEIDIAVWKLGEDPRGIPFSDSPQYSVFPSDSINPQGIDVDLVSTVYFAGYPAGLQDEANGTPVFRAGSLATPLPLNWQGKRAFLIDAGVFPGSSGSPVFALADKRSVNFNNRYVALLGVITATMGYNRTGRLVAQPAPLAVRGKGAQSSYLNLGVVTKAECVRETVQSFFEGTSKPVSLVK